MGFVRSLDIVRELRCVGCGQALDHILYLSIGTGTTFWRPRPHDALCGLPCIAGTIGGSVTRWHGGDSPCSRCGGLPTATELLGGPAWDEVLFTHPEWPKVRGFTAAEREDALLLAQAIVLNEQALASSIAISLIVAEEAYVRWECNEGTFRFPVSDENALARLDEIEQLVSLVPAHIVGAENLTFDGTMLCARVRIDYEGWADVVTLETLPDDDPRRLLARACVDLAVAATKAGHLTAFRSLLEAKRLLSAEDQ